MTIPCFVRVVSRPRADSKTTLRTATNEPAADTERRLDLYLICFPNCQRSKSLYHITKPGLSRVLFSCEPGGVNHWILRLSFMSHRWHQSNTSSNSPRNAAGFMSDERKSSRHLLIKNNDKCNSIKKLSCKRKITTNF